MGGMRMKRTGGSVKVCAAILVIALIWRMLGAPLTAQEFADLKTPMWQAKILLPQRAARMLSLWMMKPEQKAAQSSGEEDQEGVLV